MFSKTAALFMLFSSVAFADGSTTLNFSDKHLTAQLSWLVSPQVQKQTADGGINPASAAVMALQWTGNPSTLRVDVSMDMDGSQMTAASPSMIQDRPGRYHSYWPGTDAICAAGNEANCQALYFSMSGTWDICVVVHPNLPDKETACTAITIP